MLLLFAVGGMFAAVLVATVVFLSAGEERPRCARRPAGAVRL